jgi:hypothetical protein
MMRIRRLGIAAAGTAVLLARDCTGGGPTQSWPGAGEGGPQDVRADLGLRVLRGPYQLCDGVP